jgi:hypothetical protein
MLPNMRTVLATVAAALLAVSVALGLLTASRSTSVFAVGLRSAQGSPISRTLPEPPEWRHSVARAAERRAQELERLLELEAVLPAAGPGEPGATGSLVPEATKQPSPAGRSEQPAEEPVLHPQ